MILFCFCIKVGADDMNVSLLPGDDQNDAEYQNIANDNQVTFIQIFKNKSKLI